MKRLAALLLFTAFLVLEGSAQQDPMFTKYMWNTLSYNPAFAGSRDFMNFGLLHRTQYVNVDGAPNSQTFTFDTPIRSEKVGVGLNMFHDQIGVSRHYGAYAVYAYHIPLTKKARLSIGIQGGFTRFQADYSQLSVRGSDIAFMNNVGRNMGNFGLSLYYYNQSAYAFFSIPHFVEHDLREFEDISTDFYARYFRNYYAGAGFITPLVGDDIMFRPSFLIKKVRLLKGIRTEETFENVHAPTALDIDLSFLFYEKLWLGAAFRTAFEAFDGDRTSNSSINIWSNYVLKNGLRLGVAYDFTINELRSETPGSFELFIGYEFNYRKSKIATPRYF